ncbi:hypothetical protein PAESOLCIP111_05660 [Paenibacillus solanacearum]|uniref:Uncharacterized protein n=1 Tax=Paenibacillus solanacearum TaxID=2048548 RepID=A0A916NRN3_9BACL|nr:hypothetical protein [Paenibacillus solanacearum]CAG7648682.1 hypothetical protein PAESOLCIP111_05660 [Paenibacillus solanacearum]
MILIAVYIGIFFSRKKIAGDGWKDAEGRRKKIYCRKQKAIISFTFKELTELKEKELNLLTVMREKYERLKFQVEEDEVSVVELITRKR